MASHSKLQKLSNVDRISDLPDSMLLHILSFLPTKSAAVTTAVSKRWMLLCMSLPNLDFDDDDSCWNREYVSMFMRFVYYMVRKRRNDVVLDRFTLSCGGDIEAVHVDRWLWSPLQYYNVKVMKLSLGFTEPYELPKELYTCTTLEILSLDKNILVDVPESVSLSRLFVLEICDATFISCEAVERLLLNCPVLENLLIRDCTCLTGRDLNIFGPALRNLRLIFSAYKDEVGFKILIDAPALENLHIDTSEDVKIKTEMSSLKTAHINVYLTVRRLVISKMYGAHVYAVLEKISCVQFLSLSSNTLTTLSQAVACSFPTFRNLTDLEIFVVGPTGWGLMSKILATSPILVNLAFPDGLAKMYNAKRKHSCFTFTPPEIVPECLSFHLKNIQIGDFRGVVDAEFKIVEYLLKHGRVLRIMSIDCSRLWFQELTEGVKRRPNRRPLLYSEVIKKLCELQRCSTTCKLDFNLCET